MTEEKQKKIPYSNEFKRKLVKEAEETGNIKAVAAKYSVHPSSLYYWISNLKNKERNQRKKTIKQLQKELDDSQLEVKVLKELLKKTTQALIKD